MREAQDSDSPTYFWPPLCKHGALLHSLGDGGQGHSCTHNVLGQQRMASALCPLPSHTAYDTSGEFPLRQECPQHRCLGGCVECCSLMGPVNAHLFESSLFRTLRIDELGQVLLHPSRRAPASPPVPELERASQQNHNLGSFPVPSKRAEQVSQNSGVSVLEAKSNKVLPCSHPEPPYPNPFQLVELPASV